MSRWLQQRRPPSPLLIYLIRFEFPRFVSVTYLCATLGAELRLSISRPTFFGGGTVYGALDVAQRPTGLYLLFTCGFSRTASWAALRSGSVYRTLPEGECGAGPPTSMDICIYVQCMLIIVYVRRHLPFKR